MLVLSQIADSSQYCLLHSPTDTVSRSRRNESVGVKLRRQRSSAGEPMGPPTEEEVVGLSTKKNRSLRRKGSRISGYDY
ncbi:hypothetical protein ACFX2I_042859 [Malus domestica]